MFVGPKSVGILVCVVVVLHGNFVRSEQQYCDIESCSPGQHTLCLYPEAGPGPSCQGYREFPLTPEEKNAILVNQNGVRRVVAQGREIRGSNGPQPSASNMRQLEWDEDLAQVAQRWADQCVDGHDACKNLPELSVGQNIVTRCSLSLVVVHTRIEYKINIWQREVLLFNQVDVPRYRFDAKYGNYTQLVWAKTSRVGCARVVFMRDSRYCVSLVCNYGPAGNQDNEPVYEIGPPASACPNGPGTMKRLCA